MASSFVPVAVARFCEGDGTGRRREAILFTGSRYTPEYLAASITSWGLSCLMAGINRRGPVLSGAGCGRERADLVFYPVATIAQACKDGVFP